MPLKIPAKHQKPTPAEPEATVTKTHSDGGKVIAEDNKTESPAIKTGAMDPKNADQPWANVGFQRSYTHNLGDYKSTSVKVSLNLPCLLPEIDDVFKVANSWVDERVDTLVQEIMSPQG